MPTRLLLLPQDRYETISTLLESSEHQLVLLHAITFFEPLSVLLFLFKGLYVILLQN